MKCKHCESEDLYETILLEGVHYSKIECKICERFVQFGKKPENVGRRTKTSKYTPEGLGKMLCEFCRRPKAMLPNGQTIEVHHKDQDATHDVPENLLVLCTFCHKLAHFYSLYLNQQRVIK